MHLVIKASNLKLILKEVAFGPEYKFHYYGSFKVVLSLHMRFLFPATCLAGHIYVNIISQPILANISGVKLFRLHYVYQI